MTYTKRGTTTDGTNLYTGTLGSNTDRILAPGIYFGLQGDDTLTTNWNVNNALLVGGSGNDTYVINGSTLISDLGGGSDTLKFEYLNRADIPQITWQVVNVENKHLMISDSYDAVGIFDYQTEHSSIEIVEFRNGEKISFDQLLSSITAQSGAPVYYSMEDFAIPPTTADDIYQMLQEVTSYNQQYEAEVSASGLQREASLSDAQMIGRLYQAAFNRLPDEGGLNNWVSMWEQGWTTERIATAFIESEEFDLRYGANTSDAEYVQALYVNALGREPDQAGYDAWLNNLQSGGISREEMLLGFSDSAENISRTEQTFSTLTENNDQWLFA